MKVVLNQDVKGTGKKGQTVEVSDGYARNFLLRKNLAVEATQQNINNAAAKEKAEEAALAARVEQRPSISRPCRWQRPRRRRKSLRARSCPSR